MKSFEIIRERKSLIIFLFIMILGFVYIMRPFVLPMVLSVIIVALGYPLYDKINGRLSKPRVTSLLMTLLVFFLLILPSTWIISVLINQLYDIVHSLNLKATFSNWFSTDLYVNYIMPVITDLEQRFKVEINLLGVLTDFGKQVAKYIYSYSPQVLLGTATFIFNFFIMLVGIYFLFLEQ